MKICDRILKAGHLVKLTCCCCGNGLIGRQWFNRDTGYGLCTDCIKYCQVDDVPLGGTSESYGHRGVHWDVMK